MKYFYKSYKASNIENCSTEYLLWLKLKSVNDHGTILKTDMHSAIRSITSYKGSLNGIIDRMLQKGFLCTLTDHKNNIWSYKLESYEFVNNHILKLNIQNDKEFSISIKNSNIQMI